MLLKIFPNNRNTVAQFVIPSIYSIRNGAFDVLPLDLNESLRKDLLLLGSTTDVGQGLPVPTCGLGFQ